METAIVAGAFGLIGSTIGAGVVAWVAWYQIRTENKKTIENRLYDSKKAAFENGMRLIHVISSYRWNGVLVKPGDSISEKYEDFGTVARLTLYTSTELTKEIFDLFGLLDKPLPLGNQAIEVDKTLIKTQRKVVENLMRKELGLPIRQ